jgi:dTDP-4-dehydrorhamnose reductase
MRWGIYKSHPVSPRGFNTFPLDLTNRKEVGLTIREKMPEVILHTAGMTNVDACENDTEEAERQNIAVVEYIAS